MSRKSLSLCRWDSWSRDSEFGAIGRLIDAERERERDRDIFVDIVETEADEEADRTI